MGPAQMRVITNLCKGDASRASAIVKDMARGERQRIVSAMEAGCLVIFSPSFPF